MKLHIISTEALGYNKYFIFPLLFFTLFSSVGSPIVSISVLNTLKLFSIADFVFNKL